MEIKIKSIGYNRGTVGWLRKGLETGTLIVKEGHAAKGNNHGLWLKEKSNNAPISMLLAMFNPFDFTGTESAIANSYIDYQIADLEGQDGWSDGNSFGLTEAAKKVMLEIANQWVNQQKLDREADQEPKKITVVFGD